MAVSLQSLPLDNAISMLACARFTATPAPTARPVPRPPPATVHRAQRHLLPTGGKRSVRATLFFYSFSANTEWTAVRKYSLNLTKKCIGLGLLTIPFVYISQWFVRL